MRLAAKTRAGATGALGLCAGLAFAACTDADLERAVDPDSPALRMQVQANLCAPEPIAEVVPYKILFVIDSSLSNKWNDPTHKRRAAYMKAIEEFGGTPNVYFGIVTFNSTAHRPTVVFTQDIDVLTAAGEALWSTDAALAGQTNYEDAMAEMLDFIVDDMNVMDPLQAARTHYHVYWLSDGFPTEGTTHEATLAANIVSIREYVEQFAAEFVLHGLYLQSTGVFETADEITAARSLVMAIAEAGDGNFTNIGSGDTFEFEINPQPIMRNLFLGAFMVNNRHVRSGPVHPLPDSDADGLLDSEEKQMSTDPANADTDGDGYRDGVELYTSWLAPTRFDSGCDTGDLDTDLDGLADCEEDVLGTVKDHFDSDKDLLPDGLEVRFGISALVKDPMADRDLDGLEDWDEVVMHLDPLKATPRDELARWGYRYRAEPTTTTTDGRPCYALTVENVGVFETVETADHPTGGQIVELIVAFQTADQALVQFARMTSLVGMLLPRRQMPATGLISFSEAELELLPRDP